MATFNGTDGNDVLRGGGGDDDLWGGAGHGQGGADTFVIAGGRSWIMDFDGDDRLEGLGMTFAQFQAAATQQGTDLHIALADGDSYLAGVTLADVEADNLVA